MGANGHAGVRRLMEANPAAFGDTARSPSPPSRARDARYPDGSADVVLTFATSQLADGYQRPDRTDYSRRPSTRSSDAPPGGTLGVVDHSAAETRATSASAAAVHQVSTVRASPKPLASASPPRPRSRQPARHRDWPTASGPCPGAPPRREGPRPLLAIGESDRMTLRFVKTAVRRRGSFTLSRLREREGPPRRVGG